MAANTTLRPPLSLTIPGPMFRRLMGHLYPGDDDEHGAVILAGIAQGLQGTRLLARELLIAQDGVDYVAGRRGYRMLKAEFIGDAIGKCYDERLVYLAVHNHGGIDAVAFSADDLGSHERGYPALLDITAGMPVGALVFARNTVAGDIWVPDRSRLPLDHAIVLSGSRVILRDRPSNPPTKRQGEQFNRQARIFGDAGQAILGALHVGIIGVGGVGSLLVEYLARLGVGHITVVDPERIEVSNLPRLVGARRFDAMPWLTEATRPDWIKAIGRRLQTRKVDYAERIAKQANQNIKVLKFPRNVLDKDVAQALTSCDYLFLAADKMQVRLLLNAMVHQHLIPGAQLGSKVRVEKATGNVLDVFTAYRPLTTYSGCLLCNELIDPVKLQEESLSDAQQRAQRYVEDSEVVAPSVIGLNAMPVAHGINDFMFFFTGLIANPTTYDYVIFRPLERSVEMAEPRADANCPECGIRGASRYARGEGARLPVHG